MSSSIFKKNLNNRFSSFREHITQRDFSRAEPLKKLYTKSLIGNNYNYENSTDTELFSSINDFFRIVEVNKIYNKYLAGMYMLHKEELSMFDDGDERTDEVKELMLYHATSYENALSIANSNIDWRKTTRSRFGIGAYFSTCPVYAHRYSKSAGAFLICQVLVKREHEVNINYSLDVPLPTFDTTIGNECVYTKYDDFTFYPKYLVQYLL